MQDFQNLLSLSLSICCRLSVSVSPPLCLSLSLAPSPPPKKKRVGGGGVLGGGEGRVTVDLFFLSSVALHRQKPPGLLGRGAQDGHLDFHTAPEL